MDPLQFRPNPQALVPRVPANEARESNAGGVYRPPMLNPVAMEEDPDKDPNRRKRRAAEEKVRRSARSQMISDLAREVADAPDEVICSHLLYVIAHSFIATHCSWLSRNTVLHGC